MTVRQHYDGWSHYRSRVETLDGSQKLLDGDAKLTHLRSTWHTPMNEPLDYRSAGVDLKTYEETISRLPPLLRRTYTPRVIEWKNGFAGLFRLDDQIGLLVAHLPRPGAGRLDRRGRHQAQAGLRHRPARDRRHRPGRHVGQRLPVRRRRAAASSSITSR